MITIKEEINNFLSLFFMRLYMDAHSEMHTTITLVFSLLSPEKNEKISRGKNDFLFPEMYRLRKYR
ncbi:hypothetical protein XSR1_40121 [Xenorhabdus szentirmaii DSM 16338]|uniref:Uncharacterized protein n=1 Tax=Xenorhabdus szentirmaii DSM 16338 TaxID=1427518 RepID=W1J1Z9_9GAMM|nr:hypothetical protein XSR1_40121 [Xenorhabdus szentirmaii DSM 16338]